jgi:hypothetical protein
MRLSNTGTVPELQLAWHQDTMQKIVEITYEKDAIL